ncbi:MAG: lytic transglycosylase domain-containing protein, partial [Desulfovibrio sp.]|nr:lytic transglycosylase domain-containing protein [Desulfovibrio sp.]
MSRNFSSLGVGLCLCLFLVYGCAAQRERSPDVVIPSAPVAPAARDGDLLSNEIDALESTGQIDKNLPGSAKADIAREYKKYLRKGRNNMCAISKQSEQYIAYARQVFKQKGMPEELANLALVESGYTPDAVSRAGAAGAWQFMPETGRNYGLTQDIWQDDRLDPYKSTEAAAEYLRKLYNDFGDWPTAIAAYNAGEGKLARAKAQAGARDFFEVTEKNHTLDEKTQLREETRNYVPRFLAVSKIMRNLEDLGFEPINPEKAEPVVRYAAKPGTDLKDLSRACNLPWEELAKLNKHHKRTITCTDRSTFVYVPAKARKLASSSVCSEQKPTYSD